MSSSLSYTGGSDSVFLLRRKRTERKPVERGTTVYRGR